MAKISVIIPVYNAERYLEACVDSVLSQQNCNLEVILVNDGSSDHSLEICEKYAEADKRIRLINQANKGVSAARNAALRTSTGEWIMFVDADDWLTSNAIEELANAISPKVDLIAGSTLKYRAPFFFEDQIYENFESASLMDVIRNYALWSYLFRADIIRDNNIRFDENLKYSEDRLFLFNYALHAKKIKFISSIVYVYRLNNSSACSNRDGSFVADEQIKAIKKILEFGNTCPQEMNRKLENECRLLIRYSLEGFVIKNDIFRNWREVRNRFNELGVSNISNKPIPFYRFCLVSKIKGWKRKWFGNDWKKVSAENYPGLIPSSSL